MKVDHVGIAVRSIEEALPFYRESLGLEAAETHVVESQKVKVAFLPAGGTKLELLEPTSPDSAVAKFIERRGPGLHHVAFAVDGLEDHMQDLAARGRPPLDERPRPGSRGTKVCFLHPKDCHGVLVELVEHPETPAKETR